MSRDRLGFTLRCACLLTLLGLIASPPPSAGFRIVSPPVHRGMTFRAKIAEGRTTSVMAEADQQTDRKYHDDPQAHFDSEKFEEGSQWVSDFLNAALGALQFANKEDALEYAGVALHGIQDFYSHSNWAENTNTTLIMNDLLTVDNSGIFKPGVAHARADFTTTSDTVLVCDPDPGPALDRYRFLTSGYFPNDQPAEGKCTHKDLNKDWIATIAAPSITNARGATQNLHERARNAAEEHTKRLFNDGEETAANIGTALKRRFGAALGAKYYQYLTQDQAQMLFLVNITPSMQPQIDRVRAAINLKTQEMAGWCTSPVFKFAEFGAGVSAISATIDRAEFTQWINAIATYGNDNNESPLFALDKVVEALDRNSFLLMYTDAPPELDATREKRIIERARQKRITIGILASGGHNYRDTAFERICNQTGGYLFSWNAAAPLGSSTTSSVALPSIDEATGEVVDRCDPRSSLVDYVEGAAPTLRSIPVEDSVAFLKFQIVSPDSISDLNLQVSRPGGAPVQPADPDAAFLHRDGLTFVQITSPSVGTWTYEVSGTGTFHAFVEARSELQLVEARFDVTDSLFAPHGLEIDVEGKPVIGKTFMMHAEVSKPVDSAEFERVSADGAVAEPLGLAQEDSNAPIAMTTYGGAFSTPSPGGAYYLRVHGQKSGHAFQRILLKALEASTVEVLPPAAVPRVSSGGGAIVNLTVHNLGPAGTFSINARGDHALTVFPPTQNVTLATDATVQLPFQVSAPVTGIPLIAKLLVTATNVADPSITNTGALPFAVSKQPGTNAVNGLDAATLHDQLRILSNPVRSGLGWFELALTHAGRAHIDIHDLTGRIVSAVTEARYEAGTHRVGWDGLDREGRRLKSGVYFARLVVDARPAASGRIVVVK